MNRAARSPEPDAASKAAFPVRIGRVEEHLTGEIAAAVKRCFDGIPCRSGRRRSTPTRSKNINTKMVTDINTERNTCPGSRS
jgi:hypothetical protein